MYPKTFLGESGELANTLFNRISIPLLVLTLVLYEVSKYLKKLINAWQTQILDENFLIGRTLHNVADEAGEPQQPQQQQG